MKLEPYSFEKLNNPTDENSESRLFVGNLDFRITEATLIKMFSPFGTIVSENFIWHTCGPKRGKPQGIAFVQYSTIEEARLAEVKMHGRLACGRPLVVRLANKQLELPKSGNSGCGTGQMSPSARISAIKNKLKALEEEGTCAKKPKLSESSTSVESVRNRSLQSAKRDERLL